MSNAKLIKSLFFFVSIAVCVHAKKDSPPVMYSNEQYRFSVTFPPKTRVYENHSDVIDAFISNRKQKQKFMVKIIIKPLQGVSSWKEYAEMQKKSIEMFSKDISINETDEFTLKNDSCLYYDASHTMGKDRLRSVWYTVKGDEYVYLITYMGDDTSYEKDSAVIKSILASFALTGTNE